MRTSVTSTLPTLGAALLAIILMGASTGPMPVAGPLPHLGLARSAPADSATVEALSEIRLWFTEAPQEGTVSVRLLDAGEELRPTETPVADPEDGTAFSVALPDGLARGAYVVSWRAMGADGHVVRGQLVFSVTGD
jgi:methionine-rich copper-binding protein CopC